jgi:hypothetical protein
MGRNYQKYGQQIGNENYGQSYTIGVARRIGCVAVAWANKCIVAFGRFCGGNARIGSSLLTEFGHRWQAGSRKLDVLIEVWYGYRHGYQWCLGSWRKRDCPAGLVIWSRPVHSTQGAGADAERVAES